MDISFPDNKLKRICSEEKYGIRQLGPRCARILRTRLADLQAAVCLEDLRLLPGRYHELRENRAGQISVDLEHPYRLLFVPANEPIPIKADGGLDWNRVTAVHIVEIEDTHTRKNRR